MIKKVLSGLGIFSFIYISIYTCWIEKLFNTYLFGDVSPVLLLGLIAWLIWNKK